jgi:hypothetical protein
MGRWLIGVRLAVAALLVLAVWGSAPVQAQKMSDDGVLIPWFHSKAEQAARRACLNDLPECRDSVRRQIATEKVITLVAPWMATVLIIWGVVLYVRRRDARREEKRHQAQRAHIRDSKRTRPARRGADDDGPKGMAEETDEDDLGLGHPGDRTR